MMSHFISSHVHGKLSGLHHVGRGDGDEHLSALGTQCPQVSVLRQSLFVWCLGETK